MEEMCLSFLIRLYALLAVHGQIRFPYEVNYLVSPFVCWSFRKQQGTEERFKM